MKISWLHRNYQPSTEIHISQLFRTLGLQDALLQVVWRSPGGDTKTSRVVGGRNIGLKMSNANEIGQFKAQTSAKVLLRP